MTLEPSERANRPSSCPTALYKRCRIAWWVLLGCAMLFVLLAWTSASLLSLPSSVTNAFIALAYASVGIGLYFNLGKGRRERLRYQEAIANPLSREFKEMKAGKAAADNSRELKNDSADSKS